MVGLRATKVVVQMRDVKPKPEVFAEVVEAAEQRGGIGAAGRRYHERRASSAILSLSKEARTAQGVGDPALESVWRGHAGSTPPP